ncbi:MAG: DUF2520 domain-containing protein [Bacteroidetes bacterium]|nr:MAG: DUF2520 domain-containing protein [Bacteroidota bacterium]
MGEPPDRCDPPPIMTNELQPSFPPVRVAVLGAGRLAWSLIPNLLRAGAELRQLISRDEMRLREYAAQYAIPFTATQPEAILPEINLIFLTVSDSALGDMALRLKAHATPGCVCLHSSGSAPLSALAPFGGDAGVCYPLQMFTRDAVGDFLEIPLFVEGSEAFLHTWKPLFHALSGQVHAMNSEERLRLHMGAVMSNNFTNLLYRLAAENLPQSPGFEVYEALVREHIRKVFAYQPGNTQTGPAVRGDLSVIRKHLELLSGQPDVQQLYELMSDMIYKRR